MGRARVYRGSSAAIEQFFYSTLIATSADCLLDYQQIHPLYDGSALRAILKHYQQQLPAHEWREVSARHWPVLSSFAPDLLSGFPEQSAGSDGEGIEAALVGHLTHNWLVLAPYRNALQSVFSDLFASKACRLLIPDPSLLDFPSRAVLHYLARCPHRDGWQCLLGLSDELDYARTNELSLRWTAGRHEVLELIMAFDAMETVVAVDLPPVDQRLERSPRDPLTDMGKTILPDHPISQSLRALAALDEGQNETASVVLEAALELAHRAFKGFGFRSVLILGQALLPWRQALSVRQRMLLHALIGLATHNLQFTENGDERLEAFLLQHLQQALEEIDDRELEAAICYRLAVTYNRRMKQFEQGHPWAERAVAVARQLPGLAGRYQLAWARNIHAYSASKLPGQKAASIESIEASISMMQQLASAAEADPLLSTPVWANDLLMSRCVMIVNRSTLSVYQRDNPGHMAWRQQIFPYLHRENGLMLQYESRHWIGFYQHNRMPLGGLPWARAFQRSAREHRNLKTEFGALVEQARLYYQLGFAQHAAQRFAQVYQQRNRWGERVSRTFETYRGDRIAGQMLTVMPCIRGAAAAMADDMLRREQRYRRQNGEPESVDLVAARGLIAAMDGDESLAEERFNQAINLTNTQADADSWARLIGMIGRAQRVLGQETAALPLYQQVKARWLGDAELNAAHAAIALIRLQRLTQPDVEVLAYLFAQFNNIVNEIENWWWLQDWLQLLIDLPEPAREALAEQQQSGLRELLWIALQRIDCHEECQQLCELLSLAQVQQLTRPLYQRYAELAIDAPGIDNDELEQLLNRRCRSILDLSLLTAPQALASAHGA